MVDRVGRAEEAAPDWRASYVARRVCPDWLGCRVAMVLRAALAGRALAAQMRRRISA